MRYKVFSVVACLTLSALASEARAAFLFNVDVCQTNWAYQDNFEVCVDGDYSHIVFDWVIATPPGWTQSDRWYDAAANKTYVEGNIDAALGADFRIELDTLVPLKAADVVL